MSNKSKTKIAKPEPENVLEDDIFTKPEGALPIQKHHLTAGKIVKYEVLDFKNTKKNELIISVKHHDGDLEDQTVKFGIAGNRIAEILASIEGKGYVIAADSETDSQRQVILFLPYQDGKEDIYWINTPLY